MSDRHEESGIGALAIVVAGAALSGVAGFAPAVLRHSEAPPDVSTYAAIDTALEEHLLVPPGAIWRYLRSLGPRRTDGARS